MFFARQPPQTGIALHTDYVNFVQTSHLGLVVPQGDCWMKVCWGREGLGRASHARRYLGGCLPGRTASTPPTAASAPAPCALPAPQVGEQRREWEVGRVMVCETSFMHETFNNTDGTRIVLIMRHWHPEVSAVERLAIQFLFDCLDSRTQGGIAAAARKAEAALAAAGAVALGGKKRKAKGSGKAKGGGGGGFGKPAPKGFGAKA